MSSRQMDTIYPIIVPKPAGGTMHLPTIYCSCDELCYSITICACMMGEAYIFLMALTKEHQLRICRKHDFQARISLFLPDRTGAGHATVDL